jgi:hypothetical protein
MKLVKYLFVLLSLATPFHISAQNWSYIYIQGDKQTPFYVKLEGEMLPRYSKNYYIIPQLAAGSVHLQILFQQNEYPAQNFTVLVPEHGHRGFLLTRKDGSFALYDIQQRTYLMPGDAAQDQLPAVAAATPSATTAQTDAAATNEKSMLDQAFKTANAGDPKFISNVVLDNNHSPEVAPVQNEAIAEPANTAAATEEPVAEEVTAQTPATQTPAEVPVPAAEPVASPAVTETSETTSTPVEQVATEPVNEQPVVETPPAPAVTEPVATVNTVRQPVVPAPVFVPAAEPEMHESRPKRQINPDCPEPAAQAEFDRIYSSVKGKEDDEARMSYLLKVVKTTCFSTQQVYFLTREIRPESMRYSFLKKAYGKVTDQQNFRQLEDYLFKTLEWKSYFRLIYQ